MEELQKNDEQQFKDALRKYSDHLTTSSVKEQQMIIASILSTMKNIAALPEQTIKGLIRISVTNCFTRYTNPRSFAAVHSLVNALFEKAFALTIECLADTFDSFFKVSKIPFTKWSIKRAGIAGKWLVGLMERVDGAAVEEKFLRIVPALCAISFFVCGKTREATVLRKKVSSVCSSPLLKETISILKKKVNASPVGSEGILAFLSLLPINIEDSEVVSFFVLLFAKNVLLGKQRPTFHVMVACKVLFERINESQLKDEILPVAKKAMLRSTEVAIFGIAALAKYVKMDVSLFVNEFYSILATALVSANDEVHECVSASIGDFAKNISDSTAVCTLISLLFNTYSGGNGKIGSSAQRVTIINTIAKVCCHCAYGKENVNTIGEEMISKAAQIVVSETNEGILCALWDAITAFSLRMSNLSVKLIPIFKRSLDVAVCRPIVIRGMVSIFCKHGFTGFDSELAKAVFTIQTSVNSSAGEFIASTLLLLSCEDETLRVKAWENAISNKIFFKEKFFTTLSEKDILLLPELSEKLMLIRTYDSSESGDCIKSPLFCLCIALFWPVYEVRKRALSILNRLMTFEGLSFSCCFLDFLFEYIITGNGDKYYQRAVRKAEGSSEETRELIPAKILTDVVKCILTSFRPEIDGHCDDIDAKLVNGERSTIKFAKGEPDSRSLQFRFLTSTLLISSLPRIVTYDGSQWIRWFTSMEDHEHFFHESDDLVKESVCRIIDNDDINVRQNAIKLLMSAGGVAGHFRGLLWEKCTSLLSQIDIQSYKAITERDYAIFKTPEGTLYNTDVIEQNSDEAIDTKNIKRESKTYKYKEQIAEMQLRKELAEKRRREGKLTKRQKDAIEAELQAERVVREELRKLDFDCANRIGVLCAAIEGNPTGSVTHITLLYDIIIPLLHSPLVAYLAVDAFKAFRNAAFEPSEDYLHELVLHSSLRLLHSLYVDREWCDEQLSLQLERVVFLLTARCISIPTLLNEEGRDYSVEALLQEELVDEDVMSVSKICFVFPLLEAILRSSDLPSVIRLNTIQLISSSLDSQFCKINEVRFLPLERITQLLLFLISSDFAEVSQYSVVALRKLMELVDNCEDHSVNMIKMIEILLECLTMYDSTEREIVLSALKNLHQFYQYALSSSTYTDFKKHFVHRIFIARHDLDERCCKVATLLWDNEDLELDAYMSEGILQDVISKTEFLRKSASYSLVTYLTTFPTEHESLVMRLADLYKDLNELRGSVFDDVGRMISDTVDRWEQRSGVADTLLKIAPHLPESTTMRFLKIIVPEGLNDRNDLCRQLMCDAAIEIVKKYGASMMSELLPFLEDMLNSTSDAGKDDNLRQGLVLVLGTLAQHLSPGNEKVRAIAARLIETLSTPSERVQVAVSKCLPPLVPAIKEKAKELAATLSCLLVEADSYGERRGAAYGLAGLIKGLGMSAIRELELIKMLQNSLSNKKSVKHRQGALFALEMLCSTMGKLFEPYIVQVLPLLLLCFGDPDESVRRAANAAALAMMSMLSAHGVKLVLPSLIAALDEDSWRTKCASVELLGAMSHCAPKQLSACLPNIVPKLLEVLTDSHSKVQKSGEKALKQIAKVIRNPEILGISSHLLNGLIDPASKTSSCLQTIVNTKFIHYIDAPSLALIMPIIKRAFTDRNTETRRMAAQIIANIYSLTDNKDMEPYLYDLVPGLQNSLLDPVPEVRSVAAKAFGAIVACSAGDTSIRLREQIVPWLKEKLISDASSVDRSGAAQGLAEVLSALGGEQLAYAMPDIIETTESSSVSSEVRDGYILMYIYLPMVFGEKFVPYLPQVIPSVLKALADENEYVRDSALKAGQRLIAMFCSHARRLLLPQLQAALFDDNWRIRFASVTLIGDFLFNISGVSGKMTSATAGEDDTMGMEGAGKAIIRQLGQSCRDRVLAGIYLSRSDVALTVRQAAGHVWKIVVANTPRTLKEIMRTLFEMLLGCLASNSEDRQQMAARCLGELVKKMGERILIDVLPVLEMGLQSTSLDQRQGVAIALHEIIDNTTREVVAMYSAQLVEPIRKVLQDPEQEVRRAAASTFTVYFQNVGTSAFEEIISPLLDLLSTPDEAIIIDGLCEVMRQNSRQMLPYVLPKLTRPPVNAKALCALSSVAGDSLTRNLGRILEFLLNNCKQKEEIEQSLDVLLSVTDRDGITSIISTLLQKALNHKHSGAALLLHLYAQHAKVELKGYVDEILPRTLMLYDSSDESIVENAIGILICLSQNLDQRAQLASLGTLKQALNSLKSHGEGHVIPGLAHPKGLQPLLPMLREGIFSGGVEMKELAGETLGTLVAMSAPVSLKAHVVSVTGPLIRVLGDRYPPSVKLAILTTLIVLLDKVDVLLRPFLPQLQSTFLKALQELSSRLVRLHSGGALSRLMRIHPKPEPIVSELVKLLNNSVDLALIETTLICMRAVINCVHEKLSDETLQAALKTAELHCGEGSEDVTFQAASALYGELLLWTRSFTKGFLNDICKRPLLDLIHFGCATLILQQVFTHCCPKASSFSVVEKGTNIKQRHSYAIALQQACATDAILVVEIFSFAPLRTALASLMQSDKSFIAIPGVRASSFVLLSQEELDLSLLTSLARVANHQSNDVKRIAGIGLQHVAQRDFKPTELKAIVPMLVNGTKENNTPVRIAFEHALINAFKLRTDATIYETYLLSVEGAAREVLMESYRSLARTLKQPDSGLEALSEIVSVP